MKIHWIQHVSFEGLGSIAPWLAENGHEVTCTRLWDGEKFPSIGTVDGLIVMGGPMGVYDEAIYPWLAAEKVFIKQMIDQNKSVLGICLGAQLIADVLGSRLRQGSGGQAMVWKNEQKEIGFYRLRRHKFPMLGKPPLLPERFTAFHWHGDTFGIPEGAVRLASSEATENQAFLFKDNVLALQFHLETTEESLLSLYENAKAEIVDAPFIQTLEDATVLRLANGDLLVSANLLMQKLLKQLFG
jgi:GMP synthase (glutamine-hydrolysing)